MRKSTIIDDYWCSTYFIFYLQITLRIINGFHMPWNCVDLTVDFLQNFWFWYNFTIISHRLTSNFRRRLRISTKIREPNCFAHVAPSKLKISTTLNSVYTVYNTIHGQCSTYFSCQQNSAFEKYFYFKSLFVLSENWK